MNIVTTLSGVCAAMSEVHTFHFADLYEANLGLSNEALDRPVVILVPYRKRGAVLQSFESGTTAEHTYDLTLFFLRKSDIDKPYIERHTDAIQPTLDMIPEFITRLNNALPANVDIVEQWGVQADVINLFDVNLDGVTMTVSIPETETYCLPA